MPAEDSIPEDKARRTIIVVVAVIAAALIVGLFLLIGGFSYLFTGRPSGNQARLENAIRPDSPDWEKYQKQIVLDEPEAEEAKRALGDWVMTLHTTARNLSSRAINGLEIHAAVLDHQDRPVKERTVVVIPGRRDELEPNKTMFVQVMLEGMTDSDDRAKIKMEVTAFRFK